MDFTLDDTHLLLRDTVRSVLGKFGPDYWRAVDREHRFPVEFESACAGTGLFATMIPEQYGGVGQGVTAAAVILRTVAASDAGLDGCSVVHMGMFGLNPLVVHGTQEQKQEFLPRAAVGDLPTCFMVTEPDAGTDTTRITTSAVRDGDEYVVNGRKVWASRAQQAERGLLLCRTTPYGEAERPTHGMSLLFVPMRTDAIQITEIPKMGRHAVSSNEVTFDGLRVPVGDRIGEEGKGFHLLLDGLVPERVMIAAEAVGLGFHVLDRAVQYAREREVFGRPIGANQGIQLPLADAYSQLRAAELLMYEAAWLYDRSGEGGAEANMAKVRATEAAHVAVNVAFETFGGYGYAEEFDIERFYRQLPLTRVAPVTNNLAKAYVATRVLGLPKSY